MTDNDKVEYWENNTAIGFELTKLQAVEIGNMFAFYRKELKKELDEQAELTIKAFVYKNDLMPHNDGDGKKRELSAEEKAKLLKIMTIMEGMERKQYRKQIERPE